MGYSVSTLQLSKMWKLCCLQAKPVQKDAFLKIPSLYFFCWTCCGTVVPAWCASSSCCRTQQSLSSNHSIPKFLTGPEINCASPWGGGGGLSSYMLSSFCNICGLVCCSTKDSKWQGIDEVMYMVWNMPADNQSWFLEAITVMLLVLRLLLLVMITSNSMINVDDQSKTS